MPRQGWRGIDHGDGGEDEFVARAGVATLLKEVDVALDGESVRAAFDNGRSTERFDQ